MSEKKEIHKHRETSESLKCQAQGIALYFMGNFLEICELSQSIVLEEMSAEELFVTVKETAQ